MFVNDNFLNDNVIELKLKHNISGPTTFTTTMCEIQRKYKVVSDEEQSFKHYKLIF